MTQLGVQPEPKCQQSSRETKQFHRPSGKTAETHAVFLPRRNTHATHRFISCIRERQTDRQTDTRPMLYAFCYGRGQRNKQNDNCTACPAARSRDFGVINRHQKTMKWPPRDISVQ